MGELLLNRRRVCLYQTSYVMDGMIGEDDGGKDYWR